MKKNEPQPEVSRSQLIRDYVAKNPTAKHTEIAKALESKGVKIGLVNSVLRRTSQGGGINKEKIQAAAAFVKQYKGNVGTARKAVESVREFVDACHGINAALSALDTYQIAADALNV